VQHGDDTRKLHVCVVDEITVLSTQHRGEQLADILLVDGVGGRNMRSYSSRPASRGISV
jgi:hypothetical protein